MGSRKKKTRIPSPSLYTKFAESLSQTKSFILEWIIICSNSFPRPRQFQRWHPGNELGCYLLENGRWFFKELVLNKNTPLETMKGLQRVHLELKSVLFVNRYLLLFLFSCPVCRYCQTPQPVDGNKCFECDSNEVLRRLPIFICHMSNTRQRVYHISNTEKRADKTILWKVFLTIVDMLWWNTVLRVRSNFLLILGVKTCKTHEWRKTINTKKSLRSQYEPKKIIARKQRNIHKCLHRGWP